MQFYLLVFNICSKLRQTKIMRHTACQQKKHARVISGMQFDER